MEYFHDYSKLLEVPHKIIWCIWLAVFLREGDRELRLTQDLIKVLMTTVRSSQKSMGPLNNHKENHHSYHKDHAYCNPSSVCFGGVSTLQLLKSSFLPHCKQERFMLLFAESDCRILNCERKLFRRRCVRIVIQILLVCSLETNSYALVGMD